MFELRVGLWFLRSFYKSTFCLPWKKRSSHQGKKQVACIVSQPLVSCLRGCGESVNPPNIEHPGGSEARCLFFRISYFCQITPLLSSEQLWRPSVDKLLFLSFSLLTVKIDTLRVVVDVQNLDEPPQWGMIVYPYIEVVPVDAPSGASIYELRASDPESATVTYFLKSGKRSLQLEMIFGKTWSIYSLYAVKNNNKASLLT